MVDPLDSITHLLTFDYAREREIRYRTSWQQRIMIKNVDSGARHTWVCVPVLPLSNEACKGLAQTSQTLFPCL